MHRKILYVCLLALVPFSVAQAQDKAPGSGPNPYVECGIGAAVFPTVGWAAATSNAIWDLGTTAIISALSSPETCNARKVATARLILETLPSLEKDIADNSGEYLAALNETLNCSADAVDALNARLRVSYAEVVGQAAYADKSRVDRAADLYQSVKTTVDASPASCSISL